MKKRNKRFDPLPFCALVFVALMLSVFLLGFPQSGYAAIVEFKYAMFLVLCGGFCVAALTLRSVSAVTGAQPLGNTGKAVMRQSLEVKLLLLYLAFTVLSAVRGTTGYL